MISVKYLIVSFTDVSFKASDIPKLRGYFARLYPDNSLFHNHLPDSGTFYRFPVIQYRVINSHPALIGINEGFDLMQKIFFEIDGIELNGDYYQSHEREIRVCESLLGFSDTFQSYSFISPWMALNEENYQLYQEANPVRRNQLLKQILKNNFKSISKGFGYWIEHFDRIEIDGWFRPLTVNFKNLKMLCFKGEFTTNFMIPDFLGLGKQSARGFGVIKKHEGNKYDS